MGKHSIIRSIEHCANISAGQHKLPYTPAERTNMSRIRKQGAMIWYKMTHPCVDCGCSDPRVLDFDHVRGIKKFQLQQAKTKTLAVILTEIQKCEVVCANCHRLRTQERINNSGTGKTAYEIFHLQGAF